MVDNTVGDVVLGVDIDLTQRVFIYMTYNDKDILLSPFTKSGSYLCEWISSL